MAVQSQDVSGFPVDLSPSSIDRELAAMWKQLGGEDEEQGGVTRIALGNVVWLGSSRHAPRTRKVFSELVVHYPCRLFLLELVPEQEEKEIKAFINARCFLPQDLRREICCEEIHLRFPASSLPHIPAAVRSLLLPDVPTCFWYYSAQPDLYDAILPEFEAMADRMVTEVSWMTDPAEGLRLLAESRAVTSLAWYRYAPIREQIAAIFDDPRCGNMITKIRALRFGWSGDANSNKRLVHTSLIAGWMASRLEWRLPDDSDQWPFVFETPTGPVTIEADRMPGDDEGSRLRTFEVHFETGDKYALNWIETAGQMERVLEGPTTPCSGRPRFVSAAVLDDAEALGEALNTRGDRRYFTDAAKLAWPILRAALAHGVQP